MNLRAKNEQLHAEIKTYREACQVFEEAVQKWAKRAFVAEAEGKRLRVTLRNVRGYIRHCDHEPALDEIDAALGEQGKEWLGPTGTGQRGSGGPGA
jgi:hypothetical protein